MPQDTALVTPLPKRPKAYEQVAQAIRELVFAGKLTEGQRLPPERELAERFGVSRVVVREAIRTLEISGILRVQKGAGGGTFVAADFDKPLGTTISNLLAGGAITLEHLFQMRLLLEPPAAEVAARQARPEQVAELEELLSQAEAVRHDSRALRAANLEFHRRLVALAGNPLQSALCETVLAILVESLKGRLSIEISQRVLEHHHQIVRAIRERRPAEARRLTERDLGELHSRYQSLGIQVPARGEGAREVRSGS